MTQQPPQHLRTQDRFRSDIKEVADLVGIEIDEEAFGKVLGSFGKYFTTFPVAYRAATKRQRGLNLRYTRLGDPHDPVALAIQDGHIQVDGHPIHEVMPSLQRNFMRGRGGYGVDVGVSTGLEKIWAFLGQPTPVRDVARMSCMPPSVGRALDYFQSHGLQRVRIVGCDFRKRSVNLYFFTTENGGMSLRNARAALQTDSGTIYEWATHEKVARVISDLGFKVPSAEVLKICNHSVPLYFTFTWDSPDIERICFAFLATNPGEVPTHLDPLLARFVERAPMMGADRMFFFNPTFAKDGDDYFKIESDYTGNVVHETASYVTPLLPRLLRTGLARLTGRRLKY